MPITTTIQTDRVTALADVQVMAWDKTDPTLLQAVDNIRVHHFPNIDTDAKDSIGGYEGDCLYIRFPFRVESAPVDGVTPTIKRAGFQVVAFKSGEEDFVLQETFFDVATVRKLAGVQTIDVEQDANININEEDVDQIPLHVASFIRDPTYDSGTMKGFEFTYPLTLLYEYWAKLVPDAERLTTDIFEDIESPTKSWSTLQAEGWAIAVRFECGIIGLTQEIIGLTQEISEFELYSDVDVRALGSAADEAPAFTSTTKYYDSLGNEVNAIIKGERTTIIFECTGDFSVMPAGYDEFYGSFRADIEGQGGLNHSRFASTEFDSEAESPFIATPVDVLADDSHSSANVTINIYNFASIKVETIYDDTVNAWSNRTTAILIIPRLGFFVSPRQFEDLEEHLWDDSVVAEFN